MQLLKVVLELGPLVIFFLTNAYAKSIAPVIDGLFGTHFVSYENIITATAVFIVAILTALVVNWLVFRKIAAMALVTAVFVVVFGGLTIYLNDGVFIKMKPTLVNLLFAALLLGGLYFGRQLLKLVFADAFHLTERGWHILTVRWGLFFIFLALLNEIVWRNFSTDTWVSFKVFGIMPLTFLFGMAQTGVLTKYHIAPEQPSVSPEDAARSDEKAGG